MNLGKNLSHAYIISARPDEGFEKATELSAAMLCERGDGRACGVCRHCKKSLRGIHPDVTVVTRLFDDKGKQKREIQVDQIRDVISTAPIMPNEADKKVYIIRDAGTMNENAQNAFLKLLEEPPRFDAFILIADNPLLLLETVRSRCVSLNLNGEAEPLPPEAREKAEKYLAIVARGDELALLSFANNQGDMSVAETLDFVKASLERLTDMLCGRLSAAGLSRKDLMRLVALMQKAQEYLRFNVSSKQLFGLLSVRSIESK
ncbi:MAG: hypothetical protein IJY96_03695 [Oscillospiraceae bacterium]|nr:hypothetical protein [Oscillospiraceae bacterium]